MSTLLTAHALHVETAFGPLFNSLSFTLKKGDRIGLIGHNGCGKSTLLQVLDGTLAPTSGSVSLAGQCLMARVEQHLPEALHTQSLLQAVLAPFNAKVIAIDVNDGQLELAASMGADLTINSRNEDAAKVIQEKTGGAHAAVVTAVAKAAFNSAVDAVRAGGRVVAVGLPPEAMSLDIPRLVLDGIEVVGSLVGTRQDLVEAFQFAAEGKVVPKVTLRPLEDINAIFKEMEQGQIRGRMVIDLRS